MDQYIKKLLSAEPRVIIPQFGSIQALREDTVSLSFNPHLNFDDGKLAAQIQKDAGVSEEEAQRMIRDAVDSYNNRLQNGQTVTMEGIGTFFLDSEGKVAFEQDPNYTDAVSDEPSPSPAAQPLAEKQPDDDASFPKPEEPVETYEPQEDKKKHKGLWVAVAIALLLLIIWLLLFVFFKDNAAYKFFCGPKAPATEQAQPAQAPAKADTAATRKTEVKTDAAAPKEANAAAAAKALPTAAQPLKKRYNIIVGSYKDEQAALRRVEDLKAKGFSEAFVGMRKDHFVAVLADFGSISEAERVQEQIVDGPYHIESWITNSGEFGR